MRRHRYRRSPVWVARDFVHTLATQERAANGRAAAVGPNRPSWREMYRTANWALRATMIALTVLGCALATFALLVLALLLTR